MMRKRGERLQRMADQLHISDSTAQAPQPKRRMSDMELFAKMGLQPAN